MPRLSLRSLFAATRGGLLRLCAAVPARVRALRLWSYLLWGALALWLAFAGTVLTLRYWLLPQVPAYRQEIAKLVGDALHLPVSIGAIEADWRRLNPHLALHDVRIADAAGRPALAFERIDCVLSWWSVPRLGPYFDRIEIDAPSLNIRRDSAGHIFVAGLPVDGDNQDSSAGDWVLGQNIILIRNANVRWDDELRRAPSLTLEKLNFVLDNDLGGRHRFGLTAVPPQALASRLDLRGDLHGDSFATLQQWRGQLYAEFAYTDLAGWQPWIDYPVELPQGSGGLRLWLDMDGQRLAGATADVALREVRVRFAKGLPELALSRLDGRLHGALDPKGDLSLAGRKLSLATKDGIEVAPSNFSLEWAAAKAGDGAAPGGDGSGTVRADQVDLATLAALAAYLPLHEETRRLLADYAPRGRLVNLRANGRWQGGGVREWAVQSGFAGLGVKAQGPVPGGSNLSGDIDANERGGHLNLKSEKMALALPGVFVDPELSFDRLAGALSWKHKGDKLEVNLERLEFANADALGSAAGRYNWNGLGAGDIDLTARIDRADGRAVWRYLPLGVSKDARDWVQQGITAGTASDARLVLKGDLDRFPFRDGKGQFLVTTHVDGATVNYAPGWPQIEGVKGELRFEAARMLVEAREGRLFGARLGPVRAEIPDLDSKDPQLLIKGSAAGPTREFLSFIDKSPVADYIEHFTDDMRAEGEGKLELSLTVPLAHSIDTHVQGDFRLRDNRVVIDPALPPLTGVSGLLQFSESRLAMQSLAGSMLGAPLKVQTSNQPDGLTLNVQGSANMRELRRQMDLPVFDYLSGTASWRAEVRVRKKTAEVTFDSNLVGVSSSLPEPFNKSASEALPLHVLIGPAPRPPRGVRIDTSLPREQMRADLGRVASVNLVRRKEGGNWLTERGAIGVGDNQPLPERGLALAVNAKRFNADFWLAFFNSGKAGSGNSSGALPLTINLKSGVVDVLGRRFNDVQARLLPTAGGFDGQLAAREVEGQLRWDGSGHGAVRARLKSLTIPDPSPSSKNDDNDDLSELPALDVTAENFVLDGHRLGRLDLQAHNAARTWQIDRLNLTNPDGKFAAKGYWRPATALVAHDTRLEFDLEAGDTGKLLDRLGFPGTVKRGTANLDGRVQWRGPPTSIDYPTLSGDMKVSVKNGQFAKLEQAGIGRLIGLLSLQTLPRRITLDFRDVFSDGLAFDSFSGSTVMQNGVMKTDNLMIDAPAAKISMTGEVDLGRETQRLRVHVQPALGSTVAFGAALVNPITGVATLLAQKLLQNPLDQVFAYEYAITGSWDDPQVEKIAVAPPAKESKDAKDNKGGSK